MTICASVKVRDAIVLGTDSMSQVTGKGPGNQVSVMKWYANAHKLFQIETLSIGAVTWGAGNIGTRTIENLMIEFGPKVKSKKVAEVAQELFDFLKPLYDAQYTAPNQPPMGFLIAGYEPKQPLGDEYEFLLPAGTVKAVRVNAQMGASWRGIDRPFSRLMFGVDPVLRNELPTSGVPQNVIDTLFQPERWSLKMIFDAMPIQDAINFCEFILKTTIGATEFEVGAPACGGPLQVAVVRPGNLGFKWIAEPELGLRGGTTS